MLLLVAVLIFIAGYATQRGTVCAVEAVQELIEQRRITRLLSVFLCASVGVTVLAVAALLGRDLFGFYRGSALLLLPAAGGLVFGIGAWLNGRCAFGTIARLGSGELPRTGTIAGFFLGVLLSNLVRTPRPQLTDLSPLVNAPPLAILTGGAAISVVLALLLARDLRKLPPTGVWTPLRAMTVIGAVNGVLLVLATGWPYTNLLMDLAGSTGMGLVRRSLLSLTFVAGAVAGALIDRRFAPAVGSARLWARCLAGGTLMGFGATLVPGGNDTMLLVGLPLLLPSFAIAYLAMLATMMLLSAARLIPFNRPLTPAR